MFVGTMCTGQCRIRPGLTWNVQRCNWHDIVGASGGHCGRNK